MLGWARVGFQVPLHGMVVDGMVVDGMVEVRVDGSQLLPVLAPLAVLALAAVAAVLATGRWARRLLGVLLLVGAVLPAVGVLRVADEGWLTEATAAGATAAGATAAGALSDALPARSVPAGTATVLPVGPGFAAGGAALLAAAGVVLVVRGHRMPRMGRRYQAPTARNHPSDPTDERFWERMDAGEDPTASGHPRDRTPHQPELASRPGSARGAEGEKLEHPGGDPRRSQSGPR